MARVRASPEVVGFRRSGREDKLSLYANGTLIYLGDTAGSLEIVMRLIKQFGQLSGFAINWHKSTFLLLDPLPSPLPAIATQVEIMQEFRHNGDYQYDQLCIPEP